MRVAKIADMPANPYGSPADRYPSSRVNRPGVLCIRGLIVAMTCFAGIVLIGAVWRFEEVGPALAGRRIAAGVALLLNIAMYTALIIAVVNGISFNVDGSRSRPRTRNGAGCLAKLASVAKATSWRT
jgi:hypothetical protein